MLRILVNSLPKKNWLEVLGLVVHTYNTTPHKSLKTTPYELAFGIPPQTPVTVASEIQNKLAQDRLAILNKLRQQATQSLTHEQNKIHNTLKKRRKDTPEIKTGDLVLVQTKDWFPTSHQKLQPRFLGPFPVQHFKNNSVTLALPPECKWDNVVNVSRIILYHPTPNSNTHPVIPNLKHDNTLQYAQPADTSQHKVSEWLISDKTPQKILDHNFDNNNTPNYFTRFSDASGNVIRSEDSWLPLHMFIKNDHVHKVLHHYLSHTPRAMPSSFLLHKHNINWLSQLIYN